jgi:hypothetical protein
MKMGIGIGWPNASASTSVIYTFIIANCAGETAYVYSMSSIIQPGIYVYTDVELTIPFGSIPGKFWNEDFGAPITGGYEIGPTGDVKAGLNSCT